MKVHRLSGRDHAGAIAVFVPIVGRGFPGLAEGPMPATTGDPRALRAGAVGARVPGCGTCHEPAGQGYSGA